MAVLTVAAFLSKWEGEFASTGNRTITGAKMRDFKKDIADSFQSIIGATTITAWKDPCVVATTVNITLSGEQTIDGVLTSGSRVLVKNQSTTSQNGIYVSAAGAWARADDANLAAELEGAAVGVTSGTTNKNTVWIQTTSGITLGTSAIGWQQIGYGAVDVIQETDINSEVFNSQFFDFEVSSTISGHTFGTFNDGGGLGGTPSNSTFGINSTDKALGVFQCGTSTSTAGGSSIARGLSITFGFGYTITLEFRIAMSGLSDGTDTFKIFAGFNDLTNNDGVDGAYFRYTHGTNGGRWEAVTRSNSVETAEDTGVLAEAGVFHVFKIVANAAGDQVDFYIDGVKTNDITTNVINDAARQTNATWAIKKTAGSTERFLYMDYAKYITERSTPR